MLEDSIFTVAGVVNANDPYAIISNIIDVVHYPLFRPILEVNDLALAKASVKKKYYFIEFKVLCLK